MFNNIKKILIIKPSSLGDIVHSLPFLAAIKKKFSDAKIDWVVSYGLHNFLESHLMIDKLWIIKKDDWKKIKRFKLTIKEIWEFKRGLEKEKYDISIDLSGLFRSGIISCASRAKIKLGFKEFDEFSPFFYTHKIHGSMDIHAIDRYLEIAKFMGCDVDKIEYPLAPYNTKPDICSKLPKQYIIMSPGAGKSANQWQAEKFGQLAAKLDLPTIVIADVKEAKIANKVVKHSNKKAFSIAGETSLKDLIPIIKKAKFFISNDTGTMHIAAALDVPVFAIFGPANPDRTGPYGNIHTIIQKKIDCAPCYAKFPCSHFSCMNGLDVQEVFDKIDKKFF